MLDYVVDVLRAEFPELDIHASEGKIIVDFGDGKDASYWWRKDWTIEKDDKVMYFITRTVNYRFDFYPESYTVVSYTSKEPWEWIVGDVRKFV